MSNPARYWREIPQRYRYEAAKCTDTGQTFFPPRRICQENKYRQFEKVNLPTEGEVVTYTITHIAEPRFSGQVPYAVAIVKLTDGTQITAMLADVELDDVKIGMKVKIEFRKMYSVGEDMLHCYGYKCVPV